ncbi:MAG: DnaB-like helicase C-terminal domain-containing protein [Bacilli bacterium]|jgi:replicative DNA helicase
MPDNESSRKLLEKNNDKLKEISKKEERRLNSLFLKDKDSLKEALSMGVSFKYFQDSVQQQIFRLIAKYYDSYNSLLTRNTYIETVEKHFSAEDSIAFYRTQFDALYSVEVVSGDFRHLIDGIHSRSLQRQAYDICARYFEPLLNITSGQKKLVEEFQDEVSAIKKPNDDSYNRVVTLSNVLTNEVMPEIFDRRINPEKYHGIKSGFRSIDDVYFGFVRGKYMVFSAMEGGGKTTLMLNFALNMAKAGYKVVYVTIEAKASEASMRCLTIHSAVDINRIYRGGSKDNGLTAYVMGELEQAKTEIINFGDGFYWVQCLQKTPWSKIEVLLNQKLAFTDIDVIYVDYLDEIGAEVSYPNRPDLELADVSSKVQSFGKKNNVLSVSAQQMKTPKIQDLQKKQGSGDDFRFGTGDVSGTKRISAACDYLFGALLDQNTRDRIHLFNAKARQNKSAERFTLSIDLNSGRMLDLPPTYEFRKEIAEIADDVKKIVMEDGELDLAHGKSSGIADAAKEDFVNVGIESTPFNERRSALAEKSSSEDQQVDFF